MMLLNELFGAPSAFGSSLRLTEAGDVSRYN